MALTAVLMEQMPLTIFFRKTNTYLNNNWGRYFDGSGYCVMSCQVACQAACQLACQSCQYNTCHNQNCGGWS